MSTWYCSCSNGSDSVCLYDPSGSLHPHFWPHATTFGRARPPRRQMRSQCHRSPAGLPQPLRCCHGPEVWRSPLGDPSGAWRREKECAPGGGPGSSQNLGTQNCPLRLQASSLEPASPSWLRDTFTTVLETLNMNGISLHYYCDRVDLQQPMRCCHGPDTYL